MEKLDAPLVSVCCQTYNHKNYIAQAIVSFLMQKTNFNFEILLRDDASIDGTAEICKLYSEKYPTLIQLLAYKENQFQKGVRPFLDNVKRARGKYIALCEGDDYWTDPYKLQKQVDFLEANPDYVFTFHDAVILNQKTGEKRIRIGDRKIDTTVDLRSLIIEKNIPTASIVFRNVLIYNTLPEWFSAISNGDYGLCVLLAEKGPGKYLPEAMSVYRVHDGGVWSGMKSEEVYLANLTFYNYLLYYFNDKTLKKTIRQKIKLTKYNYGINCIRNGRLFKGFIMALSNMQFGVDDRLRTNPRKIGSELKTFLLKVLAQHKIVF